VPHLSPRPRLQVSVRHQMNRARISALRRGRFQDFVGGRARRHFSKSRRLGGTGWKRLSKDASASCPASSPVQRHLPINHIRHVAPPAEELHDLFARTCHLCPQGLRFRILLKPTDRPPVEHEIHFPQMMLGSLADVGIAWNNFGAFEGEDWLSDNPKRRLKNDLWF
jgi:hypothetical protein